MLIQAVVCYLIKENKVLLGVRKTSSTNLGLNLIAGFGGKIGDHEEFAGETTEEALLRELKEEIGVKLTNYTHHGNVTFIFPNKPKWDMQTQVYVADSWVGEPKETGSMRPVWFDRNNMPIDRMWEDNQYWVPQVLASKKIQATFVYNNDNSSLKSKSIEILR